jgi:hypothetical protein
LKGPQFTERSLHHPLSPPLFRGSFGDIIALVAIPDTALIRRAIDTGESITESQAKAPLHAAITALIAEDAEAEGQRILVLLNALSASDPSSSRRSTYKSASMVIRKILR